VLTSTSFASLPQAYRAPTGGGTDVMVVVTSGSRSLTWQQQSLYDYFTDFVGIPHVDYATCSPKAKGATWTTTKAKSATMNGGVTFPGLSVSAQSGFGTSQEMAFHFNVSGYICGDSKDGPANASVLDARVKQ
jgi:hypothetical protein